MEKKVMGIAFKLEGGKFTPHTGDRVGKVLEDGRVEGTDYKFDPTRINGGVAYTTNSNLIEMEDGSLQNPATGDIFEPTRKGTGYFSSVSKTFVKVWGQKK